MAVHQIILTRWANVGTCRSRCAGNRTACRQMLVECESIRTWCRGVECSMHEGCLSTGRRCGQQMWAPIASSAGLSTGGVAPTDMS